MTEEILLAPSQMDVEAITQSMAQESPQSPHKSISLHSGGPSDVFLGLSQPPGIPRGSNPVSRGNELEEPDNQSDPLFDLTFVLTFDLNISGIPLIAGECGGQAIFPQGVLRSWEHFYSHSIVAQERGGISANPPRGPAPGGWKTSSHHIICPSSHSPICEEGRIEGEGDPNGYIQAAQK